MCKNPTGIYLIIVAFENIIFMLYLLQQIAPKNVACLILTLNERILSLLQECEDPNKV